MLNLVLFVGCYLGGFFLALTRSPVWAFMLYQVIYFMNPTERWWGYMVPSISYSFFTVLLLLFVFAMKFKEHNSNRLFAAPQFKWVFFIVLGYALANLYAAIPFINNAATINMIKLVVTISIAYKIVDNEKKLDGVLCAYIAGASYIGFMVFQVGRNMGDRVQGVGTVDAPDTNGVAAAIAPTLVLALYYFWITKSKLVKGAVVLAAAFTANALVLINSRGAFLAVAGGIIYFLTILLFSKYQRPRQKSSVIAIILFGIFGALMVVDESAMERFYSIKSEGSEMPAEQETGATRVYFWLAAIDMVKDHPFGAGASGFEFYAPQYIPDNIDSGSSRNRAVHSTWFEALTDLGYLGLFCLIMLVMSVFKTTNKCKKALLEVNKVDEYYKMVALQAAFISFLIAMSFLNRFRAEVLYWCVLFSACAYNIYVVKTGFGKKQIGINAITSKL